MIYYVGDHQGQVGSPQFQMPIQTLRPRLQHFVHGPFDPNLLPNSFSSNPSPLLYPRHGFQQNLHVSSFQARELRPYSNSSQDGATFHMWPNQYPAVHATHGRYDREAPGHRNISVQQTMHASNFTQQQGASATKTSVYKAMHDCYLSNCRNSGRQDAFHSTGYNIPTYEDLERSLPTEAMVNASRIALLRSRHLMAATAS